MSLILKGFIKVSNVLAGTVGAVAAAVTSLFADGYTETPLLDENGDPITLE